MSHSEQSKVESGYSGASPQTLCLVTSKLQKLIHQDVDYQSFIDSKTDPTPTSPPIHIFNRLESGQSLARSGNEVVVDQLQIPRPGVDVDVGETKTRPNLVTSKLQKLIHQDVGYQPFIESKTDSTPTSLPIQNYNRLESGQSLARSGNEVVVHPLQIPRPGVDVDVGETKTRPNSPINNHFNEVEDTNLATIGTLFHLWKDAVINLVAAENELVFGLSHMQIMYMYPDIYKKLRKLNALNEDRRHANEYKRRQENILQISKAENVQYKINNFTSHTFNSGSSYDAVLDD